jgi:hypothetical protein
MNWKVWIVAVALAAVCSVGVILIGNAMAQAMMPYSRMGLTDSQIAACSNLFASEEKEVTCADLKALWIKECKDKKPETVVENPWEQK